MTSTVSRPALPRPDATPADCRHSRAGFHCLFTPIAARTDLSDAAKLLHAGLVSMVRQGMRWTQAEIAALLGWRARQKVWRACAELVAAGLLRVKRLGLCLPNEYTLVETEDVTQEDIKARAPRAPGDGAGHPEGRRPNAPARAVNYPKKNDKNQGYTEPPGGRDFLETRYGRLRR
jgi:hypothetical protein